MNTIEMIGALGHRVTVYTQGQCKARGFWQNGIGWQIGNSFGGGGNAYALRPRPGVRV